MSIDRASFEPVLDFQRVSQLRLPVCIYVDGTRSFTDTTNQSWVGGVGDVGWFSVHLLVCVSKFHISGPSDTHPLAINVASTRRGTPCNIGALRNIRQTRQIQNMSRDAFTERGHGDSPRRSFDLRARMDGVYLLPNHDSRPAWVYCFGVAVAASVLDSDVSCDGGVISSRQDSQ